MERTSTPVDEAFGEIVKGRDEEIDLARAALLIAKGEYPTLDVELYLHRLDVMADLLKRRLGKESKPLEVINAINAYLFHEEGFSGNSEDYYDPKNSFLNDVLDRKKGIPITLSLLYMEIACRIGLPISGVGLPGHFILKYSSSEEEILLDPFNGGIILSREDCAQRLQQVHGEAAEFQEHYLSAVTKKQILTRILANLKGRYMATEEYEKALAVINRILLISPWALDEIRDRGRVYFHLEDYPRSLEDLEAYIKYCPDAQDADRVMAQIIWLREIVSAAGG